MSNLEKNLKTILEIISKIDLEIKNQLKNTSDSAFDNKNVSDNFRALNFEVNEFFENLNENFDINKKIILDIISKVTEIIENLSGVENNELINYSLNLLNLEYFMLIHLLFVLSSQDIKNQVNSIDFFAELLDKLVLLEIIPEIKVLDIEDKKEFDDYIRLLGSAGDLFYLACSNLQKIKKKYFIDWASKCFQQFKLLDDVIANFNILEYNIKAEHTVADLYRDIVGFYTILGNTNAINLYEFILSIGSENLIENINFHSYITTSTIDSLIDKLTIKKEKLAKLIDITQQYTLENTFFSAKDKPLENISYKLIGSLEKYFLFSIAKIKAFKKEWDLPLDIPSSEELKIAIAEGESWINYVLSLTEEKENILDTPFGGLFNYLFLEYLLLITIESGKNKDYKLLEDILDQYGTLYLNKDPVFVSEFMYIKTYCQIFVYTNLNKHKELIDLVGELESILQFINNKPFIKINVVLLIILIEKLANQKTNEELDKYFKLVLEFCNGNLGLSHIENDLRSYINYILTFNSSNTESINKLKLKMNPNVLDIHSWLLPQFYNVKDGFVYINFNLARNKIQ